MQIAASKFWGGRCPVDIAVGGGETTGKTVQVQMAANKFEGDGASSGLGWRRLGGGEKRGGARLHADLANQVEPARLIGETDAATGQIAAPF